MALRSAFLRRRAVAVLGSAAVAALASGAAASSGGAGVSSAAPKATITAVGFSGSPAAPVVTVTGKGLGVPKPTPPGSPSNTKLCPRVIHGNAGLDYGTRFYVTAFADDKLIYSAGRYRPSLGELDCIGIVVLSHTATKVRFRFGAAYSQPDFGYPHIVNGDLVEVVLGKAAFGLVVRYR